MIGRIIHWVYCLPIWEAAVIALLFSGGLFWLRCNHSHRKWWKPLLILLLICWGMALLLHTLLSRGRLDTTVSLVPFQTYITVLRGGEKELLRSAFMNVLLFYPAGLLLLLLFPKWKGGWVLAGLVLISVSIEVCQYAFRLGYAEVDDVIHNTLGALLGLAVLGLYRKNNTPKG
jgi:glycopeptide antibiotics resistance protein